MTSRLLSSRTNYNSNPFHIYYDINMFNDDSTGNSSSVPVKFTETRNQPILQNPSEYFMSVVKLNIDTASLPIMIPEVQVDEPSNVNKTIYKFAFGKYGDDAGAKVFDVIYRPQDLTQVAPSLPVSSAATHSDYYFLYSYQAFIDMINKALYDGFVANSATGIQPFFTFNKESNKASVYFPQYVAPASGNPTWGGNYVAGNATTYFLYMNAPLYNLFSSLQADYVGQLPNNGGISTTTTNFGWYRLTVNAPLGAVASSSFQNNYLGLNASLVSGGILQSAEPFVDAFNSYDYISTTAYPSTVLFWSVLAQDYPTTPLWNPILSLVLTTALMPVCSELTGTPQIYTTGGQIFNRGDNNNILNIIADIDLELKRGDEYKPVARYEPISEYKLIDLQSNAPVNSIEINLFWRDSYGSLHPFLLDTGNSANLKLMFRKKLYNVNQLVNPI